MPVLIRDIMESDLVTLPSDATAIDAAERMRDNDIGDVIVADRGDLVGIVTDRDLVVRILAEGRDPARTPLAEVCSEEIVGVEPDASLDDAARLMREHAVRRLPVIEAEEVVGIVSLGDLAIEKQEASALADISSQEPSL